ncbi:XrtA/PEP-CTERM system-associated ATPase [Novosphingobium sp. ZW T3_23]|uniref:XrtA/PEP-CTERM system-associated ATPase n=1 Tax=Novosphingobium sp. ZW T3_23 TaxID=3378084 RepID=UPI003851D8B3
MFDQFYGFEGRPFQLTPDPAFYFESATHRKALSYLGYGLAQGEGFVVITGEVGAGKSTLVSHLMATIDPARLTAACIVTSALDGEAIVHVVAQGFGLPVAGHDKASALGAIEGFLHAEARAGRRCLLIVDEAQNLAIDAVEELRMLSNFQLGSHPLLQTLLLGQPEFRTTLLESPLLEQLRQRVIATHHLTAMEPREVQPYVEHRLNRVGWKGNPGFDHRVFAEVHEATGGIPRRINQIVNRLLLLGAVEERSLIDLDMLHEVLGELDEDGTRNLVCASEPTEIAAPAEIAQGGGLHADTPDPDVAKRLIEAALAQRDSQLEELRNVVFELAAKLEQVRQGPAGEDDSEDPRVAGLQEQLAQMAAGNAALEARLDEQERTLRHTLTMLIEWFEGGEGRRRAA